MRIADERWRQPRGDHVERVIAADSCEVEHFGSAIDTDARGQKVMSMRLGQQCSHDIATGIEIGGDEHQLAKARLSKILDEDL